MCCFTRSFCVWRCSSPTFTRSFIAVKDGLPPPEESRKEEEEREEEEEEEDSKEESEEKEDEVGESGAVERAGALTTTENNLGKKLSNI